MTNKRIRKTPYTRLKDRQDWNSRRQRSTVGAMSLKAQQDINQSDTWETTQEREKHIMRNMHELIDKKKNEHHSDFFVMLISKEEKILKRVLRDRLYALLACPGPNYNQTVWKYHYHDDRLEFLWTVPPKEVVDFLRRYPIEMNDMCKELIKNVFDFIDGTLARKTRDLNTVVRLI